MKNYFTPHTVVILLCLLFQLNGKSQINFAIALPACAGSTQTLSLVSGSVSVFSNTWTALPAGPVFSAPNATVTTVNFPSAGTFTLAVGAITSGGLAYFTRTISIIAGPSLTLSQSSQSTCITSNFPYFSRPVHLTASGANTYTWFPVPTPPIVSGPPGSIDVRPTSSSCYTVIGTAAGCESSGTICVSVIPQFSMQVYPNPAVRCLPDSLKLSIINIESVAVGPPSYWLYSWTEVNTSTLITMNSYFTPTVLVFPTSANSYTAEMRDSSECVSLPRVVNVTVQNCVGIESNLTNVLEIRVFPNPVLEEMSWDLESENIKIEYLTLTNTLGEMVLFINNPKAKEKIDLRFLAKGIYYLKFFSKEEQKVVKLIKE